MREWVERGDRKNEELSENRRFEVLGMEENVEEALAAHELRFREYL